jgi:hypothetical protein
MGANRNRHKAKRTKENIKSNSNTLGDILREQGVSISEIKNKIQNGEKRTDKKAV